VSKQHLELRLEHINANMNSCIERIRSYDEMLIDEDDQNLQSKYQRKIERQKELMRKYTRESNETRREIEISEAQDMIVSSSFGKLSEDEVKNALDQIRKILVEPTASENIRHILNNTSLDYRHMLKLSIPIIPLILNYETEIAVGSASNLWSVWGWLKAKLNA
jgi:hypothetical protein